MPTTLQFRRAGTSGTASITGANAELTIDTDKETVVVHDGVLAGGYPLLRANSPDSLTITAANTALNVTSNILSGNITVTSNIAVGNVTVTSNIAVGNVTTTANITGNIVLDQFGNLRKIPQSGSDKSTAYTLLANDVGRLIAITSNGSIVVPNGVFASGDVVSVYNNTAANITMTLNPANSYISGNNTNRNNAVLNVSTRGVATILYLGSNNCVVTGSVSV